MSKTSPALSRWLTPEIAEFMPGLLAIQQSPPPKLPRAVLYVVSTLFAVIFVWALLARIDIVAVADGRLMPISLTKIVQPAEAGILREVLVAEGDEVRADQVLMRLDPTVMGADSQSLAAELTLKQLTLRRIDAELSNTNLRTQPGDDPALWLQVQAHSLARQQAYRDALAQETATRTRAAHDLAAGRETLSKLQAISPIVERSAEAHRKLMAEGFYSPIAAGEKEREAIEKTQELRSQAASVLALESAVLAQDKKLAALTSNYRSQLQTERTETLAQLAKLEQDRLKLGFKTALLELRAPQAGVVKDLATNTQGAVVQPGMVLLTLVPKGEPLVAEVQVRNEDVGFLVPGQAVKLKVGAYPFQKYGLLDGKVRTIAADAQQATPGAMGAPLVPGYKALIHLDSQTLPSRQAGAFSAQAATSLRLEAGMHITAEIHQGRRTVMEYLLSPLQRTVHEAGRER